MKEKDCTICMDEYTDLEKKQLELVDSKVALTAIIHEHVYRLHFPCKIHVPIQLSIPRTLCICVYETLSLACTNLGRHLKGTSAHKHSHCNPVAIIPSSITNNNLLVRVEQLKSSSLYVAPHKTLYLTRRQHHELLNSVPR